MIDVGELLELDDDELVDRLDLLFRKGHQIRNVEDLRALRPRLSDVQYEMVRGTLEPVDDNAVGDDID